MTQHLIINDTWPSSSRIELQVDVKRRFNAVFMDPPDGIGLGYADDPNKDRYQSESDYCRQLRGWVCNGLDTLRRDGTLWVSFNAKWLLGMAQLSDDLYDYSTSPIVRPMVQVFTFGQHNNQDFGNGYRPLWRIQRSKDAKVRPDAIRVTSKRQLMGDKRANPLGRVPSDVFDFPRVVGNSTQRRAWHPTQLNEGLVEQALKSCTDPGDWVLDLFSGTGTTIRVAKQLGLNTVSVESSHTYCLEIMKEHRDVFYRSAAGPKQF